MVAVQDKVIVGAGTQAVVWENDIGNVCKEFHSDEEYEIEKEYSYHVEGLSFVPKYYNFDDERLIIEMEKIEWGEIKSLEKLVATKGLGEKVIDNIISAVFEMWKLGIDHGDLHFGNILVNTDNGDIKIIDFGYAQEVSGVVLSVPYFIEEVEGYKIWDTQYEEIDRNTRNKLLDLAYYAKIEWLKLLETIVKLEEKNMYFEILDEPRYKNKVLVVLEGYVDEQYLTSEQTYDIDIFKGSVAKDLCDILKGAYDRDYSTLGELHNDSFNLMQSNISNCTELTGYEVLFFDENGVCKEITMDWRKNHE